MKKIPLQNKRVFLRADLNIPCKKGIIIDDFRLKKILPTLDYILKKGGKIILGTHLGRPKLNNFSKDLSTKQLIPWFESHGYEIEYEADLNRAQEKSKANPNRILLLENLRFFAGEQSSDPTFAKQLASLADVYLNDAWSVLHRKDTSLTLLAQEFSTSHKTFGLLVEEEAKAIKHLHQSKQSFMLVLGGSKVTSKIKALELIITQDTYPKPHVILLGGVIAQAFLAAEKLSIGTTELLEENITRARTILEKATAKNITIILPRDVIVQTDLEAQVGIYADEAIPTYGAIIDIGPETISLFEKHIKQAKTIFTTGTMGKFEQAQASTGTEKILAAIAANKKAYTIAGGGDTIAAIHQYELQDYFDFLSTGGSATLMALGNDASFKKSL